MNKERKKLQKRKAKEHDDRKKILLKRAASRAEAKKELEEFRSDKQHRKLMRKVEEMKTYYDQLKDKLPTDVRTQLERNIEVLTALEQQYTEEVDNRKKVNEELEAKGAISMKEKMDLLQKKINPEEISEKS